MSDGRSDIVIKFGSPVYLGIGVLYHLITSDIPFAWSDPWLYITMALWPFMLLGWFILIAFAIFVIWVICLWFDEHSKKCQKREKLAKIRKESEQRKERQRIRASTPPEQP